MNLRFSRGCAWLSHLQSMACTKSFVLSTFNFRRVSANCCLQVGIGAFVQNERGEVLVVQELSGPLKGAGIWKMPTGLVSAGEDIHEAAPREVLEETVCPHRSPQIPRTL